MCAGMSFSIESIDKSELKRFFTPVELDKHLKGSLVEVFYWDRKPFVPVKEDAVVKLYDWGSRERELKLPKTGWARIESVRDGKWDWLAPKKVIIPCEMGYEKNKWFKTPKGIWGLRVRFHNISRVYVLTEKADQKFINFTGHDRMPIAV
ncbi:hypothetical protein A2223_03570 [Candidatus Falkowbacteria bacterium RIFOXYA2_FULL_35_8]|uniref:Uncharacterized protein n=1 Tax=Candidatus Falkowbacteria bacterium RIFOXYC2_FULL_36_12 TaxID=1798002 RepID=A0A1F5SWS2_9BACT|nr:MAG: hypothetical protein A2478_00435 [Candidatus Falkowbacteria bacterium RIFOXYC2_FULL_36_12]OGF31373.1 MAG: hypothetical protein A2300_01020 [Candidatus Falkowbacteria bacterium RIFOXYB2_FULL_35_7]OGF33604.1 MAG: hypothetical protein A2223_03570 [Candidatus Falkowbacteria bacterium RIFOXYA2_FULL_35_8]